MRTALNILQVLRVSTVEGFHSIHVFSQPQNWIDAVGPDAASKLLKEEVKRQEVRDVCVFQ